MSEPAVTINKTRNGKYYLKSIIGLTIMIFFGYLPAPAPMTQLGMVVLGQFIGLIFLWTFVDMAWPTFAAIILFGPIAKQVYPNSFAMAGIYEAGMQSMGSWVTVIVICLLIFTEVLNETGIIRRMAFAFITHKAAKRNPWSFTFMFLLAGLVVGAFMDVTMAQIFMLAIAKEVFELVGVDENDTWTKVITIGLTFSVVLMFAATPICHTLPILFMGIYGAIAGVPINWVSYMLISIPICIFIWLMMFAFMRFVVKPDMSKLKTIDFTKLEAAKPGPMTKREKFTINLFVALIIAWIMPGFLSLLAPNAAITTWFDGITLLTPLMVVIVIFSVVRIEGRPILDIPKTMSKLNYTVFFLISGIMLVASAMGETPTGIPEWCMSVLAPITQAMSPFVLVLFFSVASVVLTNFANNVPVGIVFINVGIPLSLQLGFNPFITAVAISVFSNLAYCIPPSFVPVGICYADPFGGPKCTFSWGFAMLIISCVAGFLVYPLGMIFS